MTARLAPFRLPLVRPFETAGGRIDAREGWILRVDEDGSPGIGEATPLAGFTESHEACAVALDAAVEAIESGDVQSGLDATADAPAARHAVATADLDRRARESDRPLYRELGGAAAVESIPVNGTIGDGPVDDTVEAATAAVDAGFDTIKLKVGVRTVVEDVERVRAVRDAIGHDVGLRLDANGAWNRQAATWAVERLAPFEIEHVEQPLPADDLEGHRLLRGGIPIAIDESLVRHSVRDVVDADAADVVVLKPMALGGPDAAHDAGRYAIDHGLAAVVSNTIDAVIARTAAVHVAASLPTDRAAGLATADLFVRDLAADPAPVADGRIRVPDGPGLGIEEDDVDA